MFHHDFYNRVSYVVSTCQVDVNNSVPLVGSHAQEQAVFCNSGIVNQNVDSAESFVDGFYACIYSLNVSYVEFENFSFYAERFAFFFYFFSVIFTSDVVNSDIISAACEFQCGNFTDTLGCTCNQCNFFF